MISAIPIPRGVAAAALVCVVTCAAAPELAQPGAGGGGNPFDGEWSLVLDITTVPGGAVIALEGGTISPYNTAYHVAQEQFLVKEDGSIEWGQSDAGSVDHNGIWNTAGIASRFWGARKLHLRTAGKAQAPRTANGELLAEDRRLTLDLTMIGGGGYSTDGTYTVTIVANIDDREVVQFPGAIRAPNPPWILKWQDLEPTRVNEEELGPDVIRQTFTYEATRQIRIPEEVNGKFNPPVTERLEIKHVHYPRLVSRG